MTAPVVETCTHSRQIRDTDPDWVYCMDCFHTIYIGGKPLPYLKDPPRLSNGRGASTT